MSLKGIKIFTGTANFQLAESIAHLLHVSLSECTVERFSDGEISVSLDESVRGCDVFLIQPTSPPVNEHLMELLAFTDACRRSSAKSITAVIPYLGYSRADKLAACRGPICGRMVADLLQIVGINHVITFDLHAPQIEGFFSIPVDHLTAVSLISVKIKNFLSPKSVVVAPDSGRVSMATQYSRELGLPLAVMHKERRGLETKITRVVGDVRNRVCLVIDDMIATGSTISETVEELISADARREFFVAATHGLFLEGAKARLAISAIKKIFVTDTVEIQKQEDLDLAVVSIAPAISSVIRRIVDNGAVQGIIRHGPHRSPNIGLETRFQELAATLGETVWNFISQPFSKRRHA
jgi:ribose-phosphate pyrophosphokinase